MVYKDGLTTRAEACTSGGTDFSGLDAATIIQDALDALTPSRTWQEKVTVKDALTLNAALQLPSYTIFDASQAYIKLADARPNPTNILENADQAVGNTDITILGGIYDGNKSNQSRGTYGFSMVKVSRFWFDGVYIKQIKEKAGGERGRGIFFSGAGAGDVNNGYITNSWITRCEKTGIEMHYCENISCDNINMWEVDEHNNGAYFSIQNSTRDVTISNGHYWDNLAAAHPIMSLNSVTRIGIIGNTFAAGGAAGHQDIRVGKPWAANEYGHDCIIANNIHYQPATGIVVCGSRNVISNNVYYDTQSDYAIILADSEAGVPAVFPDHNIVRGNQIHNSAGEGILLREADYNLIHDNLIVDPAEDGIILTGGDGDHNTIRDNTITGITGGGCYGIYINTGCDHNTLRGNKLTNNSGRPLYIHTGATGTITPQLNAAVWDDSDGNVSISHALGDHMSLLMANNQDVVVCFDFIVPIEFQALYTAKLAVVPTAANPTLRWSVTTDWGAVNEAYNADSDGIGVADINLDQNQVERLDLTNAFGGIAAGDHVGVEFARNGAHANDDAGDTHILGFLMKYV